eukprot:TRINITY_DN39824_c0_g1_i1.p1 TRINITY_DN39824_c0_g1~~TRINITY_DN39824_c0_g1_i1.p1  ORF type:complete len:229 (+),score=38.67 TRINITY_DN39824_c0_g1_i1:65-751(+)
MMSCDSDDWRLLAIQAWCEDNCDSMRRAFDLPGANINAEFQSYGNWDGTSGALYYDDTTSSKMRDFAKGKLMLLEDRDTLLDVSHRNQKSDSMCGCIRLLGGTANNTSSSARPASAAQLRPQGAPPPAVPATPLPAVPVIPTADASGNIALVKLAESLAAIDVDNTTPLTALNQLSSLKRQAVDVLAQQQQKSQRTSRPAVSLDALTSDLRALVSEGSLTLEQALALK